jgi:organic hydroperoxide reductase OsmC/OhrA
MAKVLYTAHAHVAGGREGHAPTADGQLEVDLRTPKEMGGAGGGQTPRSFS